MDSLNNILSFLKMRNNKLLNKKNVFNIFDAIFNISIDGKISEFSKNKNSELAKILEEKYRSNSNEIAQIIKGVFDQKEKQIFFLYLEDQKEKWQIIAIPNLEKSAEDSVALLCLCLTKTHDYKFIINEIEKKINKLKTNFIDLLDIKDLALIEKKIQTLKSEKLKTQKNKIRFLTNYNFLIVEDNEFNRVILSRLLENWGGKSEKAQNGKIAIDLLQKNNYDLIFMDIQMPIMDGKEAIKYIRNKIEGEKSNTPIIVVSAFSMPEAVKKYYQIGANDFIAKPLEADDLLQKITSILNISSLPETENKVKKNTHEKLYDLSEIKKMANGNDIFVEKMMRMFIKNNSEALEEIRKNQREKNWHKVGSIAHKIKPAVSVMKLPIVSDLKTIETLAKKEEDLDLVVLLIDKVERIFNKIFELIQNDLDNQTFKN